MSTVKVNAHFVRVWSDVPGTYGERTTVGVLQYVDKNDLHVTRLLL